MQATSTPNEGRFNQLAAEIVNKHGIIYVASAGNGTPCGVSQEMRSFCVRSRTHAVDYQ